VRGGQNDSLLQFLERTPTPSRNTTARQWRDYYADKPIRLRATCTRDGYEPWTQLFEFPVEATQTTHELTTAEQQAGADDAAE
jgi:hypothetical protein